MTSPKILLLILVCHCFIKGSYCKKCYDDIGCFDNKSPFNNALLHIPRAPNELGVTYKLFTRRNLDSPQFLKTYYSAVEKSNFNISTKTKFIIHGYKHSSSAAWDIKMKDEILKRENVNVILVDWVKGARNSNYAQVAANTRVVGALLWNFMKTLNNVANGNYYARMHLIGHSLGSHVAGYTGGIIERAGRITGLDPAGPLFDGTDPIVRLDSTDADFVDVIHTDRTGFGMKHSTGHVDFYPNGGKDQPGCKASISDYFVKLVKGEIVEIEKSISCSHMRAIDLFTESINSPCWFLAYPNEKKVTCDTVCSIMGYDSPAGNPIGDRFLHTESYEPYCSEYLQKTILT